MFLHGKSCRCVCQRNIFSDELLKNGVFWRKKATSGLWLHFWISSLISGHDSISWTRFLLYLEIEVTQSCLTLCDPVDPPGSSVHGILQARILEWVAISFSRRSCRPRDQTQVSYTAGRCFNLCWVTNCILVMPKWFVHAPTPFLLPGHSAAGTWLSSEAALDIPSSL